jgi:hypothetical protein
MFRSLPLMFFRLQFCIHACYTSCYSDFLSHSETLAKSDNNEVIHYVISFILLLLPLLGSNYSAQH